MKEEPNQIEKLLEKLEILRQKQEFFEKEIAQLHKDIEGLKGVESQQFFSERYSVLEKPNEEVKTAEEIPNEEFEIVTETSEEEQKPHVPDHGYIPWHPSGSSVDRPEEEGSNMEKFISENLINKIGIAITIIGVAIGVKYTIDHELISALTRILLGYLAGLTLLFFGIRLKAKYEKYSAVLVSGSMAVMYFITYAAFIFYGLLSQELAFAFMVIITISTVYASLKYDQQVIALIGLVGAYAIPFLLSNDPGQAPVLFSYMSIINIGILAVSVRKYWEPLYFASFILTWLIFFSWYSPNEFSVNEFNLAFLFAFIFFVIFYLTFLAYKVSQKQKFDIPDILLLLANSTIFYGLGYSVLNSNPEWKDSLGLFTIGNALIHFLVWLVVNYRKLSDKNLLHFISGLALVFVTIAIPVQLDGNWVTLLWAGEMASLFWIGRTRNSPVYEILSYPMVALTFISLIHSWSEGYYQVEKGQAEAALIPLFNIYFLTSVLVFLSFGFLYRISRNEKYPSTIPGQEDFLKLVSILIPVILIITLYFSFRNEIAYYWNQLYASTTVEQRSRRGSIFMGLGNTDLLYFKTIWIINYTVLFFSALSILNINKIKSRYLGLANLLINLIVTGVFLTVGLYFLGILRDGYLAHSMAPKFQQSVFNIWIRYISFGFFAWMLYTCHHYITREFLKRDLSKAFDFVLHISILWVASSELINWMNIAGSAESYKLGLSILWGVYSLLLISLGIWKKKKYLRVGAIALFAVTLIKLFLYDLTSLDTISKTIVFVSLGVLLLIISFIYNKYKSIITD